MAEKARAKKDKYLSLIWLLKGANKEMSKFNQKTDLVLRWGIQKNSYNFKGKKASSPVSTRNCVILKMNYEYFDLFFEIKNMNIITKCQTHFCLIPGGYDDKKYNIYITISSSRWGWRSTRLHKISPMLVTPTVFCGTRSSSLFHHRVLLTRSPQCLVAFLLTKTSSCYQKVICWLEASIIPIIENGCGPIFQMDWGSILDCKHIKWKHMIIQESLSPLWI